MEVRAARESDRDAIGALLEEARRCDGRPPLSEQKLVDFEGGGVGRGFVAESEGALVGYAHALGLPEAWEVELALTPQARDRARYGALTAEVVAALPPGRAVHVWAVQLDHVAALEAAGYTQFREVRQMRRRLPAEAPPPLPPGIRLAAFRPGHDDEAWLATHHRAFAAHPEVSAWDRDELDRRMGLVWFDPGDFLLAWDRDRLGAFCWTKVHDAEIGEIYIIGVDPDQRGRHLGRIMTLVGLDHLHRRWGCTVGMLYVDAENGGAVRLYSSLGFHTVEFSRCFLA